ncbi:Uncharacterised protein [Mycobacteroides abscessus subsp. abscessus]|nr:Uncharacterised protein [Mycobacteroides abscessus subsp. abscessus]
MPVPCRVTPASRHTASKPARCLPAGWNQPSGVTRFLPERRIARITAVSAVIGL